MSWLPIPFQSTASFHFLFPFLLQQTLHFPFRCNVLDMDALPGIICYLVTETVFEYQYSVHLQDPRRIQFVNDNPYVTPSIAEHGEMVKIQSHHWERRLGTASSARISR